MLLAFSLYMSHGLAIAQGHKCGILRVNIIAMIAVKIESHLREQANYNLEFRHFSVHGPDIDSTSLSI